MLFGTLRLLAILGGPSIAAPQTPAIRAGIYDIEVTYGGGVLEGTLELGLIGDSITVTMHVGEHTPAIRSVKRAGTKLTITGGAEGMALVYVLQFSGDAVVGTVSFNDSDGTVAGKRRTTKAP